MAAPLLQPTVVPEFGAECPPDPSMGAAVPTVSHRSSSSVANGGRGGEEEAEAFPMPLHNEPPPANDLQGASRGEQPRASEDGEVEEEEECALKIAAFSSTSLVLQRGQPACFFGQGSAREMRRLRVCISTRAKAGRGAHFRGRKEVTYKSVD